MGWRSCGGQATWAGLSKPSWAEQGSCWALVGLGRGRHTKLTDCSRQCFGRREAADNLIPQSLRMVPHPEGSMRIIYKYIYLGTCTQCFLKGLAMFAQALRQSTQANKQWQWPAQVNGSCLLSLSSRNKGWAESGSQPRATKRKTKH